VVVTGDVVVVDVDVGVDVVVVLVDDVVVPSLFEPDDGLPSSPKATT